MHDPGALRGTVAVVAVVALGSAALLRLRDRAAEYDLETEIAARARSDTASEQRIAAMRSSLEQAEDARDRLNRQLARNEDVLGRQRERIIRIDSENDTQRGELERLGADHAQALQARAEEASARRRAEEESRRAHETLRQERARVRQPTAVTRPTPELYRAALRALDALEQRSAHAAAEAGDQQLGDLAEVGGADAGEEASVAGVVEERVGGDLSVTVSGAGSTRVLRPGASVVTPWNAVGLGGRSRFDYFSKPSVPKRQGAVSAVPEQNSAVAVPDGTDLADVTGEEVVQREGVRQERHDRRDAEGIDALDPAGLDELAEDAVEHREAAEGQLTVDGTEHATTATTASGEEVIDLTAHDDTEALNVTGLRRDHG